jgi:hypothetical protein
MSTDGRDAQVRDQLDHVSKGQVAELMEVVMAYHGKKTPDGSIKVDAARVDIAVVKQLLGDRQITSERLESIIDHYDAWVEMHDDEDEAEQEEEEADQADGDGEEAEPKVQASQEDLDAQQLEALLHEYYREMAAAQQDQREISDQVTRARAHTHTHTHGAYTYTPS